MQARNDVTVRGIEFARAIRSILPRQRTGQLGNVVITPATKPATLRLEAFYAATEVVAEGSWSDAVQVNARLLRGFVTGRPPAAFRLVYFEGRLAVNGSTITAGLAGQDAAAVGPSYVPTNRLGTPIGQGWKVRPR